ARNDPPNEVDDKFLNTVPLGPTVGIVGAPNRIHGGGDMATSSWTGCDTTQPGGQTSAALVETTPLANDPVLAGDTVDAATDGQMVLATAGEATFAVYDGVRAEIDPANPVLVNALRLGDSHIRVVSPGLLNAIPLVDPIVPITIPGAGE